MSVKVRWFQAESTVDGVRNLILMTKVVICTVIDRKTKSDIKFVFLRTLNVFKAGNMYSVK